MSCRLIRVVAVRNLFLTFHIMALVFAESLVLNYAVSSAFPGRISSSGWLTLDRIFMEPENLKPTILIDYKSLSLPMLHKIAKILERMKFSKIAKFSAGTFEFKSIFSFRNHVSTFHITVFMDDLLDLVHF